MAFYILDDKIRSRPDICENDKCVNTTAFRIGTSCVCNAVLYSCYVCLQVAVETMANRNDSHRSKDVVTVKPLDIIED